MNFDPELFPERVRGYCYAGMDLLGFIENCHDLFSSPIFCGFISSIIRSAPGISKEEAELVMAEGLAKEIRASIFEHRPEEFDYTCIFSSNPRDRTRPLHRYLDPNPRVAHSIHQSLCRLRDSFQDSILYPKISMKTVGAKVSDEFFQRASQQFLVENEELLEKANGVSTKLLQRLEFYEDQTVPGPVEIRSSWKYNDLKPRVYFAQGGDTFQYSKYVQSFFNKLADSLEVSHTINRFFEPSDALSEEDTVMIYDYSSFTSTIQEITHFVHNLSLFFRGVTVYLIGERGGPQEMDLGELLCKYNETCNLDAQFDISKVCFFEDFSILWHTCGMLGVPGNIQSSTVLHGIHLCFISRSTMRCRCVGDDAKMYIKLSSLLERIILEKQLQTLGVISIDKTETFDYRDDDDYELETWHFAKRPIVRYHNRILSSWLAIFPTIDCFLGLVSPSRTSRATTRVDRIEKFAAIWNRLLVTISIHKDISDEEKIFLWKFQEQAFWSLEIREYARRVRVDLPKEGAFNILFPFYCHMNEFGEDPFLVIASEYLYEEEVVVPVPAIQATSFAGYIGESFQCGSSSLLTFLRNMGILDSKIVFESISRSLLKDDREFSKRLLGYMLKPLYEYTVVKTVPTWVYSLMHDI